MCGAQKEFLRPGSHLMHIPGWRKARTKNAEHTVYRKALYLSKAALSVDTVRVLESASKQTKISASASYDARVWSDDEDFQTERRCKKRKKKHESSSKVLSVDIDEIDNTTPFQQGSTLDVSVTIGQECLGSPMKRSTAVGDSATERSSVQASPRSAAGTTGTQGQRVTKRSPVKRSIFAKESPMKRSSTMASVQASPRSSRRVTKRSPVKRSTPATSEQDVTQCETRASVQNVLLRALRKRVYTTLRPIYNYQRESTCVGCDSCPRWYHKLCAGNPNVKMHWQCNQC